MELVLCLLLAWSLLGTITVIWKWGTDDKITTGVLIGIVVLTTLLGPLCAGLPSLNRWAGPK